MRMSRFGNVLSGGVAFVLTLCAATAVVGGDMPIGSNFWDIGWHNKTDIFATGWDNVSGSNPWNPTFLAEVAPYSALRFMDWDKTNGSLREDFSERTLKTNPVQRPVAYEWMIDLCNRVGADMWVTLPHKANWDYSLHLARLVRYGSDAAGNPYTSAQASPVNPPLNSDLKVYVEYSNETWNGSFAQSQYCIDQGVALGLPGQPNNPTNIYYQGWAYHAYAAVRHFERWETIFGVNSPRVVKVLAGQQGNLAVCQQHMRMLSDPVVNPNGITVDAYAIAPYFGNGVNGAAANAVDLLRADIPVRVENCRKHANEVKPRGLDLIGYEGGQHVVTSASVVNRNPEMYDLYQEYLNGIDDHMNGVFAHYVHVGTFGGMAWGSMEYTGQPVSQAHKYRALLDYAGGGGGDTNAPTPNPATFASPPEAVSSRSITMTATTGTDPSGSVVYYFTEIEGRPGASDSGWQSSPTYTDSGLSPDTLYSYTVQMRDGFGNVGQASDPVRVRTLLTDPVYTEITVCDSGSALAGSGSSASFLAVNSGPAANFLAIAAVSESANVSSMTFAGQPMTPLAEDTSTSGKVQVFGLATSLGSGTVNVTYDGSIYGTQTYGYTFLQGVDTAVPVRGAVAVAQETGTGSILLSYPAPAAEGDFALFAGYKNDDRTISASPVDAVLAQGFSGASFSAFVGYDAGLPAAAYATQFTFQNDTKREIAVGVILAAQVAEDPNADSDGDGIPDWFEEQHSGSTTGLVAHVDGDGDGPDAFAEWIALTDPTDSNSFFRVEAMQDSAAAGGPVLQWLSNSGRVYSVIWQTNLLYAPVPLAEDLPATPPMNAYTDTVHGAHSTGFYGIGVRTAGP